MSSGMAMRRCLKVITLAGAMLAAMALGACEENTYPGNDRSAEDVPKEPVAELSDAPTAVREADPSHVYPLPMARDEFTKVVTAEHACSFRMTSSDFPVLVFVTRDDGHEGGKGVMKVNGKLFELSLAEPAARRSSDEVVLEAEGVRAAVVPEEGDETSREAALRFKVDGAAERGYWGYLDCGLLNFDS